MAKLAPTVTLNNGQEMPVIGLGTWLAKPGEVEQAIKDAIDAGYRHVDGAYYYGNEREVGDGIWAKIDEGVIKREDIFVTTKLWNTFHRPDLVEGALRKSLENFRLDYLDQYLIHWPVAYQEGGDLKPKGADGKVLYSDVDYVDTWRALERCVRLGLVKGIGLSNFNSEQITRILDCCTIKPVVNQIEVHAYLNQKKMIEFCKARDIVVTAYSPLNSPARRRDSADEPMLLEDPRVIGIAKNYNKTPAQVVLRYLIQLGTAPIPKSVKKSRIIENFQLFDFELSPDDMAVMDTFDCNGRICPLYGGIGHKDWPFNIEF